MTKIVSMSGHVLDDNVQLSLGELCRVCQLSAEEVLALVEEGVIEPFGAELTQWRFQSLCVQRIRRVYRLREDLGVNLAGAALAVDLIDQIEQLQSYIRELELRK